MDPVTAAIVGSLAAGLAQVEKSAISDAYNALKATIRKKFGAQSEVMAAIEHLEKNPNSSGWRETLEDEVAANKASQDAELLHAAKTLLSLVNASPKGRMQFQQAIGDSNIQVQGSGNNINQRER